jgi:hypothetical protein
MDLLLVPNRQATLFSGQTAVIQLRSHEVLVVIVRCYIHNTAASKRLKAPQPQSASKRLKYTSTRTTKYFTSPQIASIPPHIASTFLRRLMRRFEAALRRFEAR